MERRPRFVSAFARLKGDDAYAIWTLQGQDYSFEALKFM
jgi:hypothetical protein